MGKFDSRSDEWIFLGYSTTSRDFCVYNLWTLSITEFINVVVDDIDSLMTSIHEEIEVKHSPFTMAHSSQEKGKYWIMMQAPSPMASPSTRHVQEDALIVTHHLLHLP